MWGPGPAATVQPMPTVAPKTFTDTDTGTRLQRVLVATLDLQLSVKQAHWNLAGAGFRPIHLQLDEISDGLREQADELAERAVTIGVQPDGRSATVAATTPLEQLPAGRLDVPDAVAAIADGLDGLAATAREHLAATGEQDPASQDTLIALVKFVEKERWMLRAWLGQEG